VAGAAETADKSESKASESKAPEAAPETRPEGRKAPVAAKPQVKMEDSGARTRFTAWLGRPMTSFHLIIAVAGLLTTLGLIMVLSASGVRSYGADGSAWVIFGKQVLWTIVGLVGAYAALRMSVRFIRRIAFSSYVITIILLVLVLVPGIGNLANGSRKWFVVAGYSMQPSELAKIAFAIWGAHLLAARRMERASLREMLIPLVPAAVEVGVAPEPPPITTPLRVRSALDATVVVPVKPRMPPLVPLARFVPPLATGMGLESA